MKNDNLATAFLIAFAIGMLSMNIYLNKHPKDIRAEPTRDLKAEISIAAERENLKESYDIEHCSAELDSVEFETVKETASFDIKKTYSAEDIELMARVVMNEAGGESYKCQVAVAETILNRVDSTDFPNSIREVIYQPYQYSLNSNGSITDSVYEAVYQALEYRIFDSNMVYFRMDKYHEFDEAADYFEIDNTYFSLKR